MCTVEVFEFKFGIVLNSIKIQISYDEKIFQNQIKFTKMFRNYSIFKELV